LPKVSSVLNGYTWDVTKAGWTYQVPAAGESDAGLEDYLVETRSGEQVGKVRTLIRRGQELYVVVERGNPPLSHDLRAIPWEEAETVDHDSLALTLRLDQDELERALELDPANQVEDGDADAQRVTELPPGLRQPSLPGSEAGPVDRPTYVAAISFFAIGLLAALGLALVVTAVQEAWLAALAVIPALFFIAAGVYAYRALRSPYQRR
jgi:hypothetical protein